MLRTHKSNLNDLDADALIAPLFEGPWHPAPSDESLKHFWDQIKTLFDSGEFTGKDDEIALLHLPSKPYKRIILTGLGSHSKYASGAESRSDIPFPFSAQELLRRAGGRALKFAVEKGFLRLAVTEGVLKGLKGLTSPPLYYFLEGGLLNLYKFTTFKSKRKDKGDLKEIILISKDADKYAGRLSTIVKASTLVRDLTNSPANHITPKHICETARAIKSRNLKVRILSEKELVKEGMLGFLSVASGSKEPPFFIVMEYKKGKGSPVVVIGKSITFDSGGISIKPSEGMEKMKYDMAGGAVVIGLIKALTELEPACHVIGLLPATENMPDGGAYKPGDIIKMMSGKTVEIVSTDAEGRMTLADAITYGIKYYKPSAVIDVATLTGACAITFGNEIIGMMGNNNQLMSKLLAAGYETYERVWQMPLCEEYEEYIKGDAADLKNSGGRNGSMLTAGYFLKEFALDVPWAHLDIASTAWIEKDKPYLPKGSSGSAMRLLLEFILNNA